MNVKFLFLLFIVFLCLSSIVSSETVKLNGFVNDYANIIDDSSEAELNLQLKELYDANIAQYTIVTIKSLDGVAIESYTLDLVQGKLGDTEKNNGLLLLVSLDDREYRFEVGRGLEGELNDAKIGRIGRNYLVDNFKAGEYGKGILDASLAVKSVLMKDVTSLHYVSDNEVEVVTTLDIAKFIFLCSIIIMFVITPFAALYLQKKKDKSKYFDAALGLIILFGRGGKGGSGGSGGFGGFGGGSFGGGGAGGHF